MTLFSTAVIALIAILIGILIGAKTKINPLTLIYEKDSEKLSMTRVVVLGIVAWFMVQADKVVSAAVIKVTAINDLKNVIPDFPSGLVYLICIVYAINRGSPILNRIIESRIGGAPK